MTLSRRRDFLTADHAEYADFFWSIPRGAVIVPGAAALPSLMATRETFDRRFLSNEPRMAEPDRCTEPPFALGTGALEFCSFDQSGLGGR